MRRWSSRVNAPYPDPSKVDRGRLCLKTLQRHAVRETRRFGDAIREAIAEEMRRDPDGRPHGRGRRRGGHDLQGAEGAGRGVRQGPHHRHADLRGRLHRPRRRRRDDRHAADRRHHVRRLPDAHHGPGGQPGRQDPLHVRRQVEGADGHPRDDGRDAPVGGAALAVAARVAEPHSRAEGGRSRRRPTTPRDSSRRRSATTTRSSSSRTRSATRR